ncbi:MAG: hypothetical protein JWP65_899 [Ramlibacter sp.]|uniref:hypothetical protein n=1 Tax=Ramlibacter sp. TaxID=1917967 RepID=UPI00262939B9|nr:hypothetical protein [Ramlibacter sp.]MDB5750478.1 hypothetical protein [Ramlibacter sp.]
MNKLLVEGLTDAAGFLGGALLGFWIGRLIGWDIFSPGYGNATIFALALCGIGGGAGVQVARRLRSRVRKEQ